MIILMVFTKTLYSLFFINLYWLFYVLVTLRRLLATPSLRIADANLNRLHEPEPRRAVEKIRLGRVLFVRTLIFKDFFSSHHDDGKADGISDARIRVYGSTTRRAGREPSAHSKTMARGTRRRRNNTRRNLCGIRSRMNAVRNRTTVGVCCITSPLQYLCQSPCAERTRDAVAKSVSKPRGAFRRVTTTTYRLDVVTRRDDVVVFDTRNVYSFVKLTNELYSTNLLKCIQICFKLFAKICMCMDFWKKKPK